MSFRELPLLIVSLFVRGGFDRNDGPNETPMAGRSIVGALILLLLLVLVSLWTIDALRQTDALQDCVMQGRTNCVPAIRHAPP
jgi:hypothetical protein